MYSILKGTKFARRYDPSKSYSHFTQLQLPNGITRLKRGRLLYCGTPYGKITLCDPRSNRIEHTFAGCTGAVTDVAEKGDLLVACGLGTRMGQTVVDQVCPQKLSSQNPDN